MSHETAQLMLLVALGAIFSPGIGRLMGIPAAILEIAYGVALAVLGLTTASGAPFVRFLADLGFALFLFLAGLEVDARQIRAAGVRAVAGPLAISAAATLMAVGGAKAMGWSAWVGLALGATSVPLLLSVVREAGLSREPGGQAMLLAAAVGEILTISLVALAEVLGESEGTLDALIGLAKLLAMLGLVVLGTRALGVLRWWFPERSHTLLSGDASESGVRAGFGLAFAMIAVASLAGVEPLLGAFVGGLMVSFAVEEKEKIEEKLGAMAYGFFVPVFFVDVGMRLHLGEEFLGKLPMIAGAVGLMLAVKLIPSAFGLLVGQKWRTVLASALLLAAPLTLVIAIADLAARLGAIDTGTEGALIASGMAASLIFPVLARQLLVRKGA